MEGGAQVSLSDVEQPVIMVDITSSPLPEGVPYADAHQARAAVAAALDAPDVVGARRDDLRRLLERLTATIEHFEHRMEAAERESALDPLTGLANRRAWRDALRAAEERCRRGAGPVVVAVIDLDDFKEVNDTRGHAAGDMILRTLARTLTGATRGGDTVARTGGDEFAVLAFGTDDAATVAQRLTDAIDAAGLQASIGAADRPSPGGLEEAWVLADEAMYACKSRRARKAVGGLSRWRDQRPVSER
jgi:diguanylate cyclase (GGDEF)-like protein